MTSIIISVSPNFINDKLSQLLALNDTSINESILNYGVILFENQSFITSNDQIDKLNNQINHLKLKYNKINTDYTSLRSDLEQQFNDSFHTKESNYLNKINSLESDILILKNQKTIEISSLIEKGKLLTKDEYDTILQLHLKNNQDLKLSYDNIINELNIKNTYLDNTISKLQSNNDDLNNKLIELYNNNEHKNLTNINSNINSLNDKFSNYFDKIFKGNTEKGNYGEHFIQNFLIDKFTNSNIIDTHKESAKGDLLFTFDNLKLLIESKNVHTIKKDDTDKFFRDIELQSSKNTINSAILISLNDTNLIYGSRHFHFEIKFNIPIIMISNVFNYPEILRFSILILNYLIKYGFSNIDSNDQKFINIIYALNQIFDIFNYQLNHLLNDKHSLLKLQDSFNKRETNLLNIDKLFSNLFSKYPDLSSSKPSNPSNPSKPSKPSKPSNPAKPSNSINSINSINSLNDITNIINHHISINPHFIINSKNLLSINIPSNLIRKFGGIKNIISHFNNKQDNKDKHITITTHQPIIL